jgi:hypothetical protein
MSGFEPQEPSRYTRKCIILILGCNKYSNFEEIAQNILPVVLCRCETWSLTLRENRKLREVENRVLRRIFGPKRDEITG